MSQAHILIVDDEPGIAEIIGAYLERDGFEASWLSTGAAVLPWLATVQPDLILLDLMLPEVDGMTLCRTIRTTSSVPIIMVTARVDEIDRLLGLELGADDYICKPFSPREVVARIKAVLRRQAPTATAAPPDQGFVIDPETMIASVKGVRIDLTPTEFKLLAVLATHPGKVYSRAQLLDHLSDGYKDVFDRSIDSHIKNLRRKLAAAAPGVELVQSVYGVGYRFERSDLA
ncbi:transcriptional regulator [Elstera litoralis]|uniref:Transcriptional regulator n=1 Tax=Elstera litoralis TaxID=552518 RepID=A0A0F3IWL5_9PROT|nr:response regulator [Elstera litoralis]KJV10004.1 transcriptional regulator [Elstera litoralis]